MLDIIRNPGGSFLFQMNKIEIESNFLFRPFQINS